SGVVKLGGQARRELRSRAHSELGVRVRKMELDGADADDERLRDLLVRETLRGELGDPALGRGQLARRRTAACPDALELRTSPLGPARRSQLVEGLRRALQRRARGAPLPCASLLPSEGQKRPRRVEAETEAGVLLGRALETRRRGVVVREDERDV